MVIGSPTTRHSVLAQRDTTHLPTASATLLLEKTPTYAANRTRRDA